MTDMTAAQSRMIRELAEERTILLRALIEIATTAFDGGAEPLATIARLHRIACAAVAAMDEREDEE